MAEDFMTAAVKRVEEQFAKSGVSESCAAFERKDSQIEMRDGVKLHTIYYFPREGGSGENKKYPVPAIRATTVFTVPTVRDWRAEVMCMSTSIAAAESSRKENGSQTSMSGTMALTPWITLWSSHGAKS